MSTYAVAFASNGDIGANGADFVIGWAVPVGAISELKSVQGDPVLRLECTDFRSIDLRFESASAARVFRRDINKISIADCTNETSFVFAHRRASTDEELNAWFPTDWLQTVHAPSRIRKWKRDRKGTEEPIIGEKLKVESPSVLVSSGRVCSMSTIFIGNWSLGLSFGNQANGPNALGMYQIQDECSPGLDRPNHAF